MPTPIEDFAQRTVGTVESVSPDNLSVLLDTDAPRSTAFVEGVPTGFPRINSYVLIPNESGAVVGMVTWLGVEGSPFPKRSGFKDFGVVDLPFPLRKISVSPVGTLSEVGQGEYRLDRGVKTFPSVGDPVILPSRNQTQCIVQGDTSERRVNIGTCPSAYGSPVRVDPNKLFGRHLALLGNTGSGKSCTAAWILRSCLETTQKSLNSGTLTANARFIILDPNGEYSSCFSDLGNGCRVFQVPPINNGKKVFALPAWMWNSAEWAAITQAAPRTQRPLLIETLRILRASATGIDRTETKIRPRIRLAKQVLFPFRLTGTGEFRDHMTVGTQLARLAEDLNILKSSVEEGQLKTDLEYLRAETETVESRRKSQQYYNAFGSSELASLIRLIDGVLSQLPEKVNWSGIEDSPLEFAIESLPDQLDAVASVEGGNALQFISFLTMRIRMLLANTRLKEVIASDDQPTLTDWLQNHIGADGASNGQVAVIDLSLVPYEILHQVIAVAARLIIEALQRYRRLQTKNLPTVLVLEEAHNFVSRRSSAPEDIPSPAEMCRSVFDRIAREGRKFGLGLVLSSQRPSEISETVLSQCNSFILHRMTNDQDQKLVARLVPDNASGILKELPSLPTRQALLLGLASEIPILIDVPSLPEERRPQSEDPKFWEVWTGKESRPIDWSRIVRDWTGETAE